MYYIYIYTDISYRLEEWIALEFKNWRPSPAVRPWFLFFPGPGQGVEVPALGGGEAPKCGVDGLVKVSKTF